MWTTFLRARLRFILAVIAIDVLCVGIGMGVPVLNIAFGFPLGWYIARKAVTNADSNRGMLGKVLRDAIVGATPTFVAMSIIWGSLVPWLFNPGTDYANLGIPLILFDPRNSFIGWLVLMIFISPFLQLLATTFASHLTLLHMKKDIASG